MSIRHLLNLRRTGKRPDSVIVLVGKPRRLDDGPGFVVIDRDPATLDLRALVGIRIHLIDVQADIDFFDAAAKATLAAGCTLLGACIATGAVGVSAEHERALVRYRESLCME